VGFMGKIGMVHKNVKTGRQKNTKVGDANVREFLTLPYFISLLLFFITT
jgi:hypothetical protein